MLKIEFVKPSMALAQIVMLKQTFQIYDLKNQNKIKFVYTFADKPGILALLDVESNELQRIFFYCLQCLW